MTPSDLPYRERYAELYNRSKEGGIRKVESAEEFIFKLNSTETDFLYIPAKHTIQVYLAMKGLGFTSNFEKLYELTRQEIGEEFANMFHYLFSLNEKQFDATKEECILGLEYAKKILALYSSEV
ncbi:MAG TPA: hypothetical protein PK079_10225 [Leptospiraceae bacterium]|nr:hypothetical protein [Leptospiraceae bacterium]HMW06643.1 hypothetical protein [Leptospiraceae bacterium]HMX35528.1 hypothetical protein [Leptospiraceae bacterium]HMY33694.1 hypothetical protein [Leptospiraceae bacterium]HMZ64898.1 hypothetical protein [Leptospiraceae bacterium]